MLHLQVLYCTIVLTHEVCMCRLACGYSAEEEPSEIKLLIDIDRVTCKEILRLDDKEKKLKGMSRALCRTS